MLMNVKDEKNRYCHIHKVLVPTFYSYKKKRFYCKHVVDGKECWVNTEEEMDGFREKQVDYANDQRGA